MYLRKGSSAMEGLSWREGPEEASLLYSVPPQTPSTDGRTAAWGPLETWP